MRVECPCGSHFFYVHTPPANTPVPLRDVFLICKECQRIWKVSFGTLTEVDSEGVLKPQYEEKTKA